MIAPTDQDVMSALSLIKDYVYVLPNRFISIRNRVLNDPRFLKWPASINKHHCYVGGLLVHTSEVMDIAVNAAKTRAMKEADRDVIIMAALYHDYGKIYDYEGESDVVEYARYGEPADFYFAYSDHRYKIRHVSRSYHEFLTAAQSLKGCDALPQAFVDKVAHCIISHHGRLEYGSPAEPQTPEAYVLHFADMMSVECCSNRWRKDIPEVITERIY